MTILYRPTVVFTSNNTTLCLSVVVKHFNDSQSRRAAGHYNYQQLVFIAIFHAAS